MNLKLPADLGLAFDAAGLRTIFETMIASKRLEWQTSIETSADARSREQRITECVNAMQAILAKRTGKSQSGP